MALRDWLRPPRPLLALLLTTSLASATALAWMGWRLIGKERAAEAQRLQEQLEAAADRIAAGLRGSLAETAERLSAWTTTPPAAGETPVEGLLLVFEERGLRAYPPERLVYRPFLAPRPEPAAASFARAEAVEFQQDRLVEAEGLYRELAGSKDPALQAGAMLRLARVLMKQGKRQAGLEAYGRLAALGTVPVAGAPAELVARHARCSIFDGNGDKAAARRETERLRGDLETGRWSLTRGQFEFYWSETARLLGAGDAAPPRAALAEAAAVAWAEFQREPSPRGLRTVWIDARPWLILWRAGAGRQATLVVQPEPFLKRALGDGRFRCELLDAEGRVVSGQKGNQGRAAVRTFAATQLPWTLSVTHARPEPGSAAGRERFLLLGVAAMVGFLVVGSYFMARTIRREAAVARLQSDFVSAVSHEFRSPLTSMRQLSEMLTLGRVPGEERRKQYYGTLVRETRRLQRLVETLLNFGRMEAGASQYRFEKLDPAELVRLVAAEFEPFLSAEGRRIEVSVSTDGQWVEADPEALSLALRNLIDNALKYSPGRPAVWVDCAGSGEHVAIRVRDEGIGIGAGEQRAIFRKFVRGSGAQQVNAKGTGVGLAMVQHIVRAHGGEIQLESEPGKGSTFTVLLPAVTSI